MNAAAESISKAGRGGGGLGRQIHRRQGQGWWNRDCEVVFNEYNWYDLLCH